ncbi:ABC transporter permease [Nesterenkonia alba]|uniref:ABC transporter permease n=1 Tax=Nesterenkonia alba TaxID=515814 RepID=UPI0003B3906E|nr:ABC transporter permease [Nesterenkonia alba]
MNSFDVIRTAFGNTLRSKMRTALTVIAIVIGAFTLTLTSGLGAGINQTVDRIMGGFGEDDALYIQSVGATDDQQQDDGGPPEYDPEAADDPLAGIGTIGVLTEDDLDTIRDLEGITSVEGTLMTDTDYLETPDGDQYAMSLDIAANDVLLDLAAGERPASGELELTIPEDWLVIFDTENPEDVIGETITIGASNAVGQQQTIDAEISGVSHGSLSGVGFQPVPSFSLMEEVHQINQDGYEGAQQDAYIMATAQVENLEENEEDIKAALSDEGMLGLTMEDQISMFQTVIDAVTWILSGFALIALLAASFGIVNTLLMSVQERTREIGLMKALGMSSGKVFGLFSMEAVVIGIMGSVIGVVAGLGVGFGLDAWLTADEGPLGGFAELSLFGLNPLALGGILALIIVIAFLAGTLPAMRAAKKDPIEALRYE